MTYDPERHHRRSIRLKDYDYTTAGVYFVTVCTQERACLFGEVIDGAMRHSDAGTMVQRVWDELSDYYPGVGTDQFVVMPNHVHGLIVLVGAAPRGRPSSDAASVPSRGGAQPGQAQGPAPTGEGAALSLPDLVHRFKTMTTKRYADGVKEAGWLPFPGRLWQRNYYEHVVRDEAALDRFRRYIENNPARWSLDDENPEKVTR